MKKIAITGGIASGKSTVCHILEKHGAYVLYSDTLIHQLLEKDPTTKKFIVELLGKEVLDGDRLDRERIAEIVFNDKEKLLSLERHLHPKLFQKIDEAWEKVKKRNSLFVVEMPLVQEIGMGKAFDLIVAVTADETSRKKRFPKRDFDQRIKRQWSQEKKVAKADFKLVNNGTLEDLEKDVLELMKEINAT